MNRAIATLLELEQSEGLWSRQVLAYPVWAVLRLGCYHRLLAEGAAAGAGVPGALRRRRSWDRAPTSARDVAAKLLPALRERDVWVLGSTLYRRGEANGTSRSIFAQHLEQQLGSRLVFLEANATQAGRSPAENVVFLDVLRDLARTLASRSARWLPVAWAGGLGRSELGLDARAVLTEALYGNAWRQVARALFAQGKPRAVFVLCAYGQHIPFQLEARARGVPIIELQHGVIHESHPGYVFGPGVAPQHAPDHLVAFGEHYGRLLESGGSYWKGRWSVGGHPWLKAKRAAFAERPQDDSIVLFGQNVPAVQQQLRALALELRRVLPADVRVVLKPHPAEKNAAEIYAGISEQGVVVAAPGSDSYEQLGRCRVSVSVFSTIAVEALAFRCASVVLRSPHWFEDIRTFVEQGFIQVADGAADVVRVFREVGPARQTGLDRALFGVGAPSLDFERLIETLRAPARK